MKKILSLMLVVVAAVVFTGCGDNAKLESVWNTGRGVAKAVLPEETKEALKPIADGVEDVYSGVKDMRENNTTKKGVKQE